MMKIPDGDRSSSWGPATIGTTGAADWAVATGSVWEQAYVGDQAVVEITYGDVFGNSFATNARWESAAPLGISGGWFKNTRMEQR